MEFHRHQNQVEEDEEEMGVPMVFDSLINSATNDSKMGHSPEGGGGGGGGGVSSTIAARKGSSSSSIRYRECLKNHAVGIGGHAVDGCREFLAASEEGKLEALRCAACNCHRNFHRKETDEETTTSFPQHHGQHHHHHQQHFNPHQVQPYYLTPSPASGGYLRRPYQRPHPLTSHQVPHYSPLALPTAGTSGEGRQSREEEDMSNPTSSGGGGSGSGTKNKRFRTKFTQEQKDRMLAFAERLGWRMQKHDDATVEQFCAEIGVKRHVLKVWMHNNKNSLSKKR